MDIVHEGSGPGMGVLATAQRIECGSADDPSELDIERMLRADRTRFAHFRGVAASLAASWREVAR